MPALDWIFVAVLLASVLVGAWRGLIYEMLALVGWVIAFLVAQWSAPAVGAWLPMSNAAPALRYAAGFLLVFILTAFACGLLASVVRKLVAATGLRPADRVLGTAFGLTRGVVIVLVVAVVFLLTPLRQTELWAESAGAPVATAALRGLKPMLPDQFGRHLPD